MNRLDRQSFLGSNSEQILQNLRVGILGLGGGGSHVVQQLAHAGIGDFVLIDNDEISMTNLNRLVGGTLEDVIHKRAKVEIARQVINSVNPQARISPFKHRWQEVAFELRDCDVIFGCMDNVRSKAEIEAFCRRLMIPYIDQGMDVHEIGSEFLIAGQVHLSLPGHPCLRCFNIVTDEAVDEENRNYGAAGERPQVVWPNGVLASSAVGLMMQMVLPWDILKPSICLEYDGNRHTMIATKGPSRPCSHYDITGLGDPMFDIRGAEPFEHMEQNSAAPFNCAKVPSQIVKPSYPKMIKWLAARLKIW